jgi:hypothetical protein
MHDASFRSNISQIIVLGTLYDTEIKSRKEDPFPLQSPKSILFFLSPSTC